MDTDGICRGTYGFNQLSIVFPITTITLKSLPIFVVKQLKTHKFYLLKFLLTFVQIIGMVFKLKKFVVLSLLFVSFLPRWLGYVCKLGQRLDSAEMFSVPANISRKKVTAFLFTFEKKDVYKIQSNNNRRLLF